MRDVARHLATIAKQNGDNAELFARTSFNRYYYDCFLVVRQMCGELGLTTSFQHKQLPQYLRDTVAGRFKNKIKTIQRVRHRRNAVSGVNLPSLISSAITHLNSLAEILESAYAIRVIADYQPDFKLAIDSNRSWSLHEKSLEEAENWVRLTDIFTGKIKHAWRQLP